jgi:chlorobactene glucosyltransferase
MIAYVCIVTAMLAGLFCIVVWNLVVLRSRTYPELRGAKAPRVSILVPARNEEHNIEACITSLLAQDYPDFEVIALDDESTDGTGVILDDIAACHDALRVLRGTGLPDGWIGKNHACHQLARVATGDWLLFTDADTVHAPHALRDSIRTAIAREADLLTLIPEQEMRRFAERLILPLLHFVSMTLLPFYLIEHSRRPSFAIGIGQFMLFRRAAYEAIGGHAAVRNALVEDVWLARLIKERGFNLRVISGIGAVRCRMYRSFAEIWRGFSKNIFAGFNFSLPSMAAVLLMLFLLFVMPYAHLAVALLTAQPTGLTALVALQVLLILGIRLLIGRAFALGVVTTILHPVGILCVIAIAVNSWRWIAWGGGAQWKGRTYRPSSPTQDITPV